MKQPIIKQKIIIIILTVSIVFGSYASAQLAHAQVVVSNPTSDSSTVWGSIQNGITATASVLSEAYNYITSTAENSMWIKEYVLDPIAWTVAKSLVQTIVNQTVDWINGGFSGSPAFVQNPEQFFQKIGDNIAGNFIAGPGSPLSALCSPISLNVRLALALDQAGSSGRSGGSNPYTCTLSKIINNVGGASISGGASITGFESGDFSQGGWPAFLALGTEPQNNLYGAYINASLDLNTKIGNQQETNQNLLNQGGGFLSYQQCTPIPASQGSSGGANSSSNNDDYQNCIESGGTDAMCNMISVNNIPTAPPGAVTGSAGGQNCQTVTPGSVISASLNKALGASQDSLVTADEISEIIGALAGQLVNQVLGSGGLFGTTQPSGGGGTPSYITQIEAEANAANSSAASSAGQTFSSSQISTAIGYENQIKGYEDSSLQILGVAQTAYSDALLACQNNATVTDQINNDTSDGSSSTINSLIGQLQIEDDNAATTTTALDNFSQEISTVTSTDQLNSLMQEWTQASGQLPSAQNVSDARGENTNMQAEAALATSTAARYQSECGGSTDTSGTTGGTGLGASFQ